MVQTRRWWGDFSSVPFFTHEKHSSFLIRSKGAAPDARGQINYPRRPFPLSSPPDTTEKSGPYQRPKGPSASQPSYFPPFYFTLTFHCSFSFPRLLSLSPISLYPFHAIFLHSSLSFNPTSHITHFITSFNLTFFCPYPLFWFFSLHFIVFFLSLLTLVFLTNVTL